MDTQNSIIMSIAVIAGLGFLLYLLVKSMKPAENVEGWVNYNIPPFGFQSTCSGNENVRPAVFYNVPRYRRPYNWPVCHLVDYPNEHCEPNENM